MKTPYFDFLTDKLWVNARFDADKGDLKKKTSFALLAHEKTWKRLNANESYFWKSVETAQKELGALAKHAAYLRENFEGALLFGIGGSYLGAAAILEAFGKEDDRFRLHWVVNTDPVSVQKAKAFAAKHRCAAIVMSKSGTTLETLSAFFSLSEKLDRKGWVFITDPEKGFLREHAQVNQIQSFAIPPKLGGRFSVFSPCGLLPCLLKGVAVDKLLEGAKKTQDFLAQKPTLENPAYLWGWYLFALDQAGFSNQYLMPYWNSLEKVSGWHVQLWAESLGKINILQKKVGGTPIPALGTTDQHSILQMLREAPENKAVGFLDVASASPDMKIEKIPAGSPLAFLNGKSFGDFTRAATHATEESLAQSGVPSYRFVFPEWSEAHLGSWMIFSMLACAYAGELYQVNPYDQPGVELTKKIWKEKLTQA